MIYLVTGGLIAVWMILAAGLCAVVFPRADVSEYFTKFGICFLALWGLCCGTIAVLRTI